MIFKAVSLNLLFGQVFLFYCDDKFSKLFVDSADTLGYWNTKQYLLPLVYYLVLHNYVLHV